MKEYKVTVKGDDGRPKSYIVQAMSMMDIAQRMKEIGLAGKIVRHTEGDRKVSVTCVYWTQEEEKWVRHAHNWIGHLAEVKGQKSCPKHRS